MKNGQAFSLFEEEVQNVIKKANDIDDLKRFSEALSGAMKDLKEVTTSLFGVYEKSGAEIFLADATLYLEFFGNNVISWQWLLQALVSKNALAQKQSESDINFYNGKLFTCRYFFHY